MMAIPPGFAELHMKELQEVVIPKVSTQWTQIAPLMNFDSSEIQNIKGKCGDDPNKCCTELFELWLQKQPGRQWEHLLPILEKAEDSVIYDRVTAHLLMYPRRLSSLSTYTDSMLRSKYLGQPTMIGGLPTIASAMFQSQYTGPSSLTKMMGEESKKVDESTVKLDQEILRVIKDAKEEGLVIKVRHSKVLFCGSSKVGKTNFINLLLKNNFEESHKPTGVAESHQLLAKHCQLQVTLAKGCTLQYMDYKTQIAWLRWFLSTRNFHSPQNTVPGKHSIHQSNDNNQPGSDSSINNQLQPTSTVENQIASEVDAPPDNFPEVWNMLTFLDTGGQPAFINMLPALNSSAMITFILHSMEGGVDSLTNKVTVYGDGPEYSLDYNYIDLVKMLFSMRKPKELQMFEQFLVEKDSKSDKNCYLSLVGTKSDLCEDSDTVAKNIGKELKPIIDQTIHKSSLIPIGKHFFVPVSNCKANTEDEDPVAAKFRDRIFEYLEKRDMFYIPIVWLILELEILNKTKEEDVIHFDDVFKICKENALITNEADVRTALQFFHHVGIFLYYGSDNSDMKNIADIVITNYQWIFKNLAAMVKATKSDDNVTEEFRCNGLLNKHVIECIDWKLGKDVSEEYFLKLLERLSIISPTNRTQTPDEYFMPCVLPTFSFDTSSEQNLLTKYGTKGKADPLLMQLVYEESVVKSCHYDNQSHLLPRGVFCCLVNQLLLDYPRFKVQRSKVDKDACVFNNLIVLYDDIRKCFVVLIDRFMYLKLEIRQNTTVCESLYDEIKLVIGSTLKYVCGKLRLDVAHICVGFLCSEDDESYWTRKKNYDQITKNDTIFNQSNNPKQLEESQKIWFLDQCSTATTDALSTTLSSAADTTITVLPTSTSIAEAQSVSACSQHSVVQSTSQQSSVTVTQQQVVHDVMSTDDHPVIDGKLIHKHVIPRISAEWETVAAYLEYSIPMKKSISKANRGLPRECCTELLEDWISSDNGVKPKTWEKFMDVLSEISSLAMVTKQIKQCLCQEGVLGGQRSSQRQEQQVANHQPVPVSVHQQSQPTDKKERKIPKENLRYTLNDLILQTKDKLEGFDNNMLDKHSHKTIINGVHLLLMVVNSSEFYAAMKYFSRSEARKLESDGDIYYVGKWGKISAALIQQSKPGIAGPDGSQQLTIASINLFKNLEVIIALGVCGTIGQLGDVIVSSRIDGCDNIKIVGNNSQIINRGIKANPGRKIYKHLKQNHEIWSFLCTKQETEIHEAKAVIKPMLSGVPLVASAEYREKFKKSVSLEAEGLEMEGIGVIYGIESAEKKDKIEFIIVKAGCDYADEYKSKEWQPVAAMAAADFVYYQLSKSNWLSEHSKYSTDDTSEQQPLTKRQKSESTEHSKYSTDDTNEQQSLTKRQKLGSTEHSKSSTDDTSEQQPLTKRQKLESTGKTQPQSEELPTSATQAES